MEVLLKIEANLLIFAFGAFMLFNMRIRAVKLTFEHKSLMILTVMILVIQLLLSGFWALSLGSGATIVNLRVIDDFLYYFVNDITPFLWVAYVYFQVERGRAKLRSLIIFLVPLALMLALLFSNPFTHAL